MDFRYLLDTQFTHSLNALPEDFNVLAMALECTNSGVVITDFQQPDNPIIFCNHAFENLTGYLREEIIGRNCRFLQGNDLDQDSRQLIKESIEHGVPVTAELRNYDKNGVPFWNELSISPVRNREGRVTHFIGIQKDVTRKRTLEVDLMQQIDLLNGRVEKQSKYIEKVEGILFKIMESRLQCIVMLDQQLNIVRANDNFYNIFHTKACEVVGRPFDSIQNGQWHDPKLHSLLVNAFDQNQTFEEFPLRLPQPNYDCPEVFVTGRKIQIKGMPKDYILVIIRCKFTSKKSSTVLSC